MTYARVARKGKKGGPGGCRQGRTPRKKEGGSMKVHLALDWLQTLPRSCHAPHRPAHRPWVLLGPFCCPPGSFPRYPDTQRQHKRFLRNKEDICCQWRGRPPTDTVRPRPPHPLPCPPTLTVHVDLRCPCAARGGRPLFVTFDKEEEEAGLEQSKNPRGSSVERLSEREDLLGHPATRPALPRRKPIQKGLPPRGSFSC